MNDLEIELDEPMPKIGMQRALLFAKRFSPSFLQPLVARVEASSIMQRMATGTFWSLAGYVLTRILGLLTTVLTIRILGKELYGQIGMVQSTVDMFSIFAGLGLSFTTNKHVAEFRRNNPERAGRVIAMASILSWISGIIVTIAVVFSAPFLAERTLHTPQLSSLLQLGALLLLFGTINAAQTGSLAGFEAFKNRAYVNTLAAVVSLPVVVGGAKYFGITGALTGTVFGAGLLCLFNFIALQKQMRLAGIRPQWHNWHHEVGVLLKFALPTMATSMMIPPVGWACNTMLANTPKGFAELGIFNAASQWSNLIAFLPSLMGGVSMTIYAELAGAEEWQQLGKLMWGSVFFNCVLILPVFALSLASPWLMRVYGSDFAGTSLILIIRLVTTFLTALYTPVWPMLLAVGKARAVFVINALWAGVLLVLTYWMVRWGVLGMALANLIATFLYLCALLVFARHVLAAGKHHRLTAKS
ncbi:MAG: oligosaccharide flippase family protein [Nibricoccus sp.]